jgi:hypothetical protein
MTTTSNYAEEYAQIATIFSSEWVEGSPPEAITPIAWPGIPFTVPLDANGEPVNHVRFFITNGDVFQISIGAPGANVFRHTGILTVKIFTKSGLGELPAKQLADKFCAIFRNKTYAGIRFKEPSSVIMGMTEDGFYQINAFCAFERDSLL